MWDRFSGALSVVGLLLATVPAVAHHSIQAQIDYDKPVTLAGQLHQVAPSPPEVAAQIPQGDRANLLDRPLNRARPH
jgi:hypothetical protein